MRELNNIELDILQRLSLIYPSIKKHIPLLKVLNSKITGVGMFVNFFYVDNENIPFLEIKSGSLSTNEDISLINLKYGLGYEVDITDSKINFIEFITYGELWDGKFIMNETASTNP